MVMMLPHFRSFIPGRKPLIVRNVAVRFPSTDARHPSSLVSSSGPGTVKLPPALATRISTGPNSRSICCRIVSIPVNFVASARTRIAVPPSRRMSASTAESASASRPLSATFAPSRANSWAIAAPMPRELPVISATLLFSLPMASLGSCLFRWSFYDDFAILEDRSLYSPTPCFLGSNLQVWRVLSFSIDDLGFPVDFDTTWFPWINGFHIVYHQRYFLVAARNILVLVCFLLLYPADVKVLSVELESHRRYIWLQSFGYCSDAGEPLRLQVIDLFL